MGDEQWKVSRFKAETVIIRSTPEDNRVILKWAPHLVQINTRVLGFGGSWCIHRQLLAENVVEGTAVTFPVSSEKPAPVRSFLQQFALFHIQDMKYSVFGTGLGGGKNHIAVVR